MKNSWKRGLIKNTELIYKAPVDDPRNWKIYRNRTGWPCWYQRWLEAWWIIIGKWSLHRAWQEGKDYGQQCEWHRTVIMGGR